MLDCEVLLATNCLFTIVRIAPTPFESCGFASMDEVVNRLRRGGVLSIIAVQFTRSDFEAHDRVQHERAISCLGQPLATCNEGHLLQCWGFGDESTQDEHVFSFHADNSACNGTECAIRHYREIFQHVVLGGPSTSLRPVIKEAINRVVNSGGQYHVLVVIAVGESERTNGENKTALARHHHKETMDAIVEASHYPLSIVVVGVGDGSFEKIQTVNEELKQLSSPPLFNNYKFVNSAIREGSEAFFAYHALRDILVQYTTARSLGLLRERDIRVLRPPIGVSRGNPQVNESSGSTSRNEERHREDTQDDLTCLICLEASKNTAFIPCGHQTCGSCAWKFGSCLFCRKEIVERLTLY
ncbi:unnamed protein product [Calypogeia fissa]